MDQRLSSIIKIQNCSLISKNKKISIKKHSKNLKKFHSKMKEKKVPLNIKIYHLTLRRISMKLHMISLNSIQRQFKKTQKEKDLLQRSSLRRNSINYKQIKISSLNKYLPIQSKIHLLLSFPIKITLLRKLRDINLWVGSGLIEANLRYHL